jgi:hypothetical protein
MVSLCVTVWQLTVCGDDDNARWRGGEEARWSGHGETRPKMVFNFFDICCNFFFHVPPFIYFFINYILLLVGMKVLRVACESDNHICVDLIKINGVCHLQKGLKLLFSKLKGLKL